MVPGGCRLRDASWNSAVCCALKHASCRSEKHSVPAAPLSEALGRDVLRSNFKGESHIPNEMRDYRYISLFIVTLRAARGSNLFATRAAAHSSAARIRHGTGAGEANATTVPAAQRPPEL